MGTVALSVWLRFFAWLWDTDWFARSVLTHDELQGDELQDHLKRDLGLLDGRDQIGPERTRQSDELRKALRLPPRSL